MATDAVAININSQENDNYALPPRERPSVPRLQPLVFSMFLQFRQFWKWSAWLVPSIVVVNVVLLIVTMCVNNCPVNSDSCIAKFLGRYSFESFKRNFNLGPSADTLEKMGALDVYKVVYEKQVWRLFSSVWLHGGVFHVFSNMLTLLFIGLQLEHEFGFVRIGLLYIISGFGASLLSALFIRSYIAVGASGAIFGLIGGMLSEFLTNWTLYTNKMAALLALVSISISNLACVIIPNIDNFGHIGGFLSGFLGGFVFLVRPQYGWVSQKDALPPGYIACVLKPKHKMYQYVLWIISLMLLVAGFASGLFLLLKGVNMNDYCPWCHYLNCVPMLRKCNAE